MLTYPSFAFGLHRDMQLRKSYFPRTEAGRTSLRRSTCISLGILWWPLLLKAIEPKPQESTLHIGNQVLKPIEVINPWRTTHRVGTNRFFVTGSMVQRPAAVSHEFVWTANSDDGSSMSWLEATTNVAYLVGYKTSENGRFQEYDFPPRIRRLDLGTGKWLPDLMPSVEVPSDLGPKSVLGLVVAADKRVVVLTDLRKRQPSKVEKIEAYNLCLFKEGEIKPIWTRQFRSEEERPRY